MPHVHVPYPEFSVDCVREIFRLVRGRTVADELQLFVKCLYELIGSGLKLTVGEPDNGGPILSGQSQGQLNEASVKELQECGAALDEAEGQISTFGATDDKSDLSPAGIALLIQLAKIALEIWLKRRQPK